MVFLLTNARATLNQVIRYSNAQEKRLGFEVKEGCVPVLLRGAHREKQWRQNIDTVSFVCRLVQFFQMFKRRNFGIRAAINISQAGYSYFFAGL